MQMLVVSVFLAAILGIGSVNGQSNSNLPSCVATCLTQRFQAAGCASQDFNCACQESGFQTAANNCFRTNCQPDDAQIGLSTVDTGCSNEASTSIAPPFSSGTSTVTSLSVTNTETSPPESGSSSSTSSPTSISASTTVTATSVSTATSFSTSTSTPTSISTSTTPTTISVPPTSSSTTTSSTTETSSVVSSLTGLPSSTSRAVASPITTSDTGVTPSGIPSGTIQSIPTGSSGVVRELVVDKLFWAVALSVILFIV
ncbi:hypothetical protein M422DRAFT_26706 [Sphaerobolus stellatus SS14]|nr:hypothetical protein M422DRAFT_26706 [Sphaerobolus stellatus SS14]